MAEYGFVPDEPLLNMARHSAKQVAQWQRDLTQAKAAVERSEKMLAYWCNERDDQYLELDTRDIPAPD